MSGENKHSFPDSPHRVSIRWALTQRAILGSFLLTGICKWVHLGCVSALQPVQQEVRFYGLSWALGFCSPLLLRSSITLESLLGKMCHICPGLFIFNKLFRRPYAVLYWSCMILVTGVHQL